MTKVVQYTILQTITRVSFSGFSAPSSLPEALLAYESELNLKGKDFLFT